MAARAAVNPRLSVRTLADDLRDEQRRLDALDAADPDHGMRAVFSYSYRQVSPAAARLFRLLGSHPGPDVSTTAAASLAGVPVDEARRLLDELTTAHLVSAQGGRFVLHDLLRVYAAEQPDGERRAATLRVLDHYLHSANAADVRLHATRRRIALDQPGVGVVVEEHSSRDDAVRWCTAEHKALVEAVALAAGSGFDQHTWQLAWATASYFDVHGHWADWAKTQQVALAVTERLRDLPAQVRVCSSLGHAYARMRQLDEARAHFARGLSLSEASGDRSAQGGAHSSLGWMAEQEGRFEDALRHSRRALELFTETGNRSAQGRARAAIGWDLTQLGHLDEALVECGQALEVFRENMDVWYEASVLDTIGLVHHRASRYAEAIGYFRKALETQVDSLSTSTALVHLGDALLATGDAEGARRSWQEALTILEELGSPTADELRTKLRGS
jgi:tetratricopeptide (TPR) repeat protein